MNVLEIVLLPFVYLYRIFIGILLLPYYILSGIGKLFNTDKKRINKKAQKAIIEAKKSNNTITVKDKKSVINDKSNVNTVTNNEKTIKKLSDADVKKRQKAYDKYIKKAREEEKRRIKEIEKIKKREAQKDKLKQQKELSDNKQLQDELKNDKQNINKKRSIPFSEKINNWFNRITPEKQVELEAKQKILKEGFKEDVKKDSDLKPMLFSYVAKSKDGKLEKGEIEALTRMDVNSFLEMEGYEVYDIFPTKSYLKPIGGYSKISKSRLVFCLSQLSAYLKSGIALADSVKILYKQTKKAGEKAVWKSVYYDLSMGDVLSVALDKRDNAFPKLLINMIKTAEMTGNLAETLDEMVDYYSESEQTRRQMKSAMTYPVVILTFAFAVVVFILVWIIPEFEEMYKDLGSELPAITQFVMRVSKFLQSYWYLFLIAILVISIVLTLLYKNVRSFRKLVQGIAMHLPVFGNIIIYNEVNIFTKTFANLINHNVFITDSIDVLSKITDNEIYKDLIFQTADNLNKGDTVSKAFENQWAFPDIAYQMLVTGEKTGRLGPMMEKVSEYYSEQHRNIINQMKTLIEPFLIITLAGIVGFILISVLTPMFDLYNNIQ